MKLLFHHMRTYDERALVQSHTAKQHWHLADKQQTLRLECCEILDETKVSSRSPSRWKTNVVVNATVGSVLTKVKMFRAQTRTRRFRKNQKVWVREEHGNHLSVWFRWKGSGRYVQGTIDKFHNTVGLLPLKEFTVSNEFAQNIRGPI